MGPGTEEGIPVPLKGMSKAPKTGKVPPPNSLTRAESSPLNGPERVGEKDTSMVQVVSQNRTAPVCVNGGMTRLNSQAKGVKPGSGMAVTVTEIGPEVVPTTTGPKSTVL